MKREEKEIVPGRCCLPPPDLWPVFCPEDTVTPFQNAKLQVKYLLEAVQHVLFATPECILHNNTTACALKKAPPCLIAKADKMFKMLSNFGQKKRQVNCGGHWTDAN